MRAPSAPAGRPKRAGGGRNCEAWEQGVGFQVPGAGRNFNPAPGTRHPEPLLITVQRLRLVLVYVEDGQELGDGEQVFNLGLEVEELELPLLARDGRVARHQLADAA